MSDIAARNAAATQAQLEHFNREMQAFNTRLEALHRTISMQQDQINVLNTSYYRALSERSNGATVN